MNFFYFIDSTLMRKTILPLLALLGAVPAVAQWQSVTDPVPVNSVLQGCQLDAVNGQTAWFTNTSNSTATPSVQVLRTSDGGQTWQNSTPAAPATGRYTSSILEAFDNQHAWLLLGRSNTAGTLLGVELHYTADGGATWSLRSLSAVPARQSTLCFFSVTEGLLFDQVAGILYRTTDGGLTWQLQNTTPALSPGQFLSGIHKADGILWVDVYNAQAQPVGFWASPNRGLTWRSELIPAAPGAVVFRDAQHALLPTPQGGMLSSADGALTWQNATIPPCWRTATAASRRLGPLTAVPGTRAYVAGAENWIGFSGPRGSAITHDDGQTWTLLESNNSYQSIQFTAPDAGWHIRASFAAPTWWYEYEGIGRYEGSPLAIRTTSTPVIAADVFPNPSTSGIFTVQIPATVGPASSVRVLDALGRVVYQAAALPADKRLDLSQQPKGIYSLEVQTNNGLVRRKLLVE